MARRRPARHPRSAAALILAATLTALAACGAAPDPPSASTPGGPNPTATSAPTSQRPSGLIWDSGLFDHNAAHSEQFEQMRGRKIDVLGVAPTRDSWEQVLGDWWLGPKTIPKGFTGTLNVAVPLFPDNGSYQEAVSGAYDDTWRQLGAKIAQQYPDAYVRPGWEFNIKDWRWSANPQNVEQFKEAFRRAATGLRAGGPRLRIVWNPNEGRGNSLPDASQAWPGDQYVDVVGIDAYDWHPAYDQKGWDEHRTKDQGWDYWARFARQHGKTFAVPEWGVYPGNEASGGDNPKYIEYVYEWMLANRDLMAFETYFDERDAFCRCSLSLNPKARAAYLRYMDRLAAPAS